MLPIYIYFHICTLGDWTKVVNKLYNNIIDSTLIEKVDKIFVVVLGQEVDKVRKLLAHDKVKIIYHSINVGIYERYCLEAMHKHSLKENCKFLYIHSKGITKKYKGVEDWMDLMIYFNITLHQNCIDKLNDFDTVGVNINTFHPLAHYSGNFWWANSSYIKKLPAKIGPKYLDPEFWIGSGKQPKMLSHWQSETNHYRSLYPTEKYIGKIQSFEHYGK